MAGGLVGLLGAGGQKMAYSRPNALNNCEKTLFMHLKRLGVAEFYWDDDHFFMDDPEHKASLFIRENRSIFGNSLSGEGAGSGTGSGSGTGPGTEIGSGASSGRHQTPRGEWHIIDTPSDTAQAAMMAQLLENEGITGGDDLTSTAVILADEKLLMPVLGSLPASVEDVNVTMGHPFRRLILGSVALIRSTGQQRALFSDDVFCCVTSTSGFGDNEGDTVVGRSSS